MNKRFWVILLMIGGAAIIIAVLIWMLYPIRTKILPSGSGLGQTGGKKPPSQPSGAPRTPLAISPEEQTERQLQDKLKQQASAFVGRQGSYSSVDAFEAIRLAGLDASAEVQVFLQNERERLIQTHPAYGPSWGQTTHVLSARIISPLPMGSRTGAQLTVQAQVTTQSVGEKSAPTYQEFSLTMQKSGTAWIVTNISSQALAL
ncbi:hypothetical protein EXS71_03055 [Candidatus Uhrbacteria bacterium]|nr:hypothetical protein [Candidatus Uhrbacteria bacterium]